MTTSEYLDQAPKGTTRSAMQRIIQTHNGDRAKIKAAIKELWAKHEEENSWVEVAPKQKKKAQKQATNNFRGKKPYNGHHNGQKKPASSWNQNQQPKLNAKENVPSKAVEEDAKPPTNSWASKLFKPEPEEPKAPPPKVLPPPVKAPPTEREKSVEKPKKQAVDVTQIEAELFKESDEKAEKEKAVEPPKPKVKPGVSFSASIKTKAESADVASVGRVSFGKVGTEISLATLAQNEGKELVSKGTTAKLKQLEMDLERATEEISRLKARHNEVQAEINQAADKSLKYSRRVQELEAEAKEKANLREEVSKLTKQLEEHQLQARQYYDRYKEEPSKKEDEAKPPQQPPATNPPQPGYNMPQQQPVYPGMQYFPGYYSQFHHYPPQNPGPGHPPSRYGYEGQVSHPPPSHPPGPSPSPPPDHHGHFSHDEFRGMRRGLVPPPPSSRDMGMDKKAQHTAPPGYGGQQHHPYSYPPNMVYQQQQQQFPPGQGQQKWNGGR